MGRSEPCKLPLCWTQQSCSVCHIQYTSIEPASALAGQLYEDPCNSCPDHFADALSMSDITDIDDVTSLATGLGNTFSGDVIDDADLSSLRESLSCDLSRYIQYELTGWSKKEPSSFCHSCIKY